MHSRAEAPPRVRTARLLSSGREELLDWASGCGGAFPDDPVIHRVAPRRPGFKETVREGSLAELGRNQSGQFEDRISSPMNCLVDRRLCP